MTEPGEPRTSAGAEAASIVEHALVRAQTALRASEDRLRRLWQSDVIGLVIGTFDGRVIEANDAYLRLVGYTRDELERGELNWRRITTPETICGGETAIANLSRSGAAPTFEKEYIRRDGTRVAVLIGAALLETTPGCAISFVLDNSQHKAAEAAVAQLNRELEQRVQTRTEELHQTEQRMRALAAHLQTVREEERTELAREIHDVLGQELTGLKLDVAWTLRKLGQQPTALAPVVQRLESMQQLIDSTIGTVRRMATDLRPGVLDDLGLVPALEWQARELERRAGLPVRFQASADDIPLDRARATAMFRICQELLTNVARHSGARAVAIDVRLEDGAVVLEVTDDGRGFEERDCSTSNSLGLLGIRERAAVFGGSVAIRSVEAGGTSVVARLPLPLPDPS